MIVDSIRFLIAYDLAAILYTMQLTVQKTPNPNALKFVLSAKTFGQPLNFSSTESAAAHPLAMRLFAVGNIFNVFMAQDFITVNKLPQAAWPALEVAIQAVIVDYFRNNRVGA